VATWQSELLRSLAAKTVADTRATFRSLVDEAVNLGLIATNPVDRVRPPKARPTARRALTASEARAVVAAAAADRLGAALALLFVRGWRVSEVLGPRVVGSRPRGWRGHRVSSERLRRRRWDDARTSQDRGRQGPPPPDPGVVELLRRRRRTQDEERLVVGADWQQIVYEGRPIELDFTTVTGGLLLPQAATKAVAAAAVAAGLDPAGLRTHAGRSTAITVLYAEEGLDLADVRAAVVESRLPFVVRCDRSVKPRWIEVEARR
jgi:integrase